MVKNKFKYKMFVADENKMAREKKKATEMFINKSAMR